MKLEQMAPLGAPRKWKALNKHGAIHKLWVEPLAQAVRTVLLPPSKDTSPRDVVTHHSRPPGQQQQQPATGRGGLGDLVAA